MFFPHRKVFSTDKFTHCSKQAGFFLFKRENRTTLITGMNPSLTFHIKYDYRWITFQRFKSFRNVYIFVGKVKAGGEVLENVMPFVLKLFVRPMYN